MADRDIILKLLQVIDRDPAISQKQLAEEIGISTGMINWHVKRCVAKGLVKLQRAPVRRYLYYLTPDGFSEKAKLTANYLKSSFQIFRQGRVQYNALFTHCRHMGWCNVVLAGDTELTELALMISPNFQDIRVRAIIDSEASRENRDKIPIVPSMEHLHELADRCKVDAVIVCRYLDQSVHVISDTDIITALALDRTHLLIPDFLK